MASHGEKDKEQNGWLLWLLAINVVVITCPVSAMAAVAYGKSFPIFSSFVLLGSSLLLVLSLVALRWTARRCARSHYMAGMEAWWWVMTPYTAGFPLAVLLFPDVSLGGAPWFIDIFLITAACVALWTIITLGQLLIPETRDFTTQKKLMLAFVVIVCIPLIVWLSSAGNTHHW